MVWDVLAIPITIVAFEDTFNISGRINDSYCALLTSKTMHGLICGGDWLPYLYGIKKKGIC